MKKEKQLEKAIQEYLEKHGCYVRKIHSGKICIIQGSKKYWMQLAPEGTPDLCVCINGKALYIEVKKDEKTQKQWQGQVNRYVANGHLPKSARRAVMQHLNHKQIARAGGSAIVVGSIQELENDLLGLGFLKKSA